MYTSAPDHPCCNWVHHGSRRQSRRPYPIDSAVKCRLNLYFAQLLVAIAHAHQNAYSSDLAACCDAHCPSVPGSHSSARVVHYLLSAACPTPAHCSSADPCSHSVFARGTRGCPVRSTRVSLSLTCSCLSFRSHFYSSQNQVFFQSAFLKL
jgi:hypothetical protein